MLLFLAAIVAAFWYLRVEEADRELEALRRDVEYAQQRVRLRLLERQEQLMRVARDLANKDMELPQFHQRAESLIGQYPELQAITWIDESGRVLASHATPTIASAQVRVAGEVLRKGDTQTSFALSRSTQQPVYSQPALKEGEPAPLLQLQVPLNAQGNFAGVVLGEYSVDNLLRYGTPTELLARYAITLLDSKGEVLAGVPLAPRERTEWMPWSRRSSASTAPGVHIQSFSVW